MAYKHSLVALLLVFGIAFAQTHAFECGFYRIQSVASGRNVEVHQGGLPLFVGGSNSTMVSPHESSERDFTIWYIEKRSLGRNPTLKWHYMIRNNATKMYARLYQETSDLTVLVAEKGEPTFFDIDLIENHEWSIKLSEPSKSTIKLWTVHELYHQLILEQEMITKKGIPKAAQRFRLHAV